MVAYVKTYYQLFIEQDQPENLSLYESIKVWHPKFELESVPSPKIRQSDIFALNLARIG